MPLLTIKDTLEILHARNPITAYKLRQALKMAKKRSAAARARPRRCRRPRRVRRT